MAQMHRVGKTATTVVDSDRELTVTYHDTGVVRVDRESGNVTLDTGGWHTATTAARMNQAANQFRLGFRVHRYHGHIIVNTGFDNYPLGNGPFTFNRDGEVTQC